MMTVPKIEQREAQPYVAIRAQVSMEELDTTIQQLRREVIAWIAERGIEPAGAPFLRNRVVDMEALLDIEVGLPVAPIEITDERVKAGVLPEGRYAALRFTDWSKGIEANAALLNWGENQGFSWDAWDTERGRAFGARLMSMLTNPDEEPNQEKWVTEVAIRLS